MEELKKRVGDVFTDAFGRTPLKQRLDDITNETIELGRFTDLRNLKEEAGDLMASLIQLYNECEWDINSCVNNTLDKIKRRKLQYQTLGRKIKVALYAGSFDPVTLGHIQAAEFVLNVAKEFDEIWFLPCYKSLYGKQMNDPQKRLDMLELATQYNGCLKTWDYEIKNKFTGESYQFVKQLLEEDFAKDQYDFSIIIGLDNALKFKSWVNCELLEKMIRFVIMPRKGYTLENQTYDDWFLKSPHIYLGNIENPIMDCSSTMVRNKIKNGEDIRGLVSEDVENYIYKNNLYICDDIRKMMTNNFWNNMRRR